MITDDKRQFRLDTRHRDSVIIMVSININMSNNFQGAAWVYLLLGSSGQDQADCGQCETGDHGDNDRVSASSGIASGTSSQPWLEDQDLSGSSCECNTDNSNSSRKSKRSSLTRRQRNNNNIAATSSRSVTKAQCHGGTSPRSSPVSSRESNCSPGLNSAYRAMVSLAGNRTPSIEQSRLTETTDCPSDISVITSISTAQPGKQSSSNLDTELIQSRLAGFSLSSSSPADRPDVVQVHHRLQPREEDRIQRVSETRGRVTLPPTHLRALVRDRLRAEGISLSSHPYTQVSRCIHLYQS